MPTGIMKTFFQFKDLQKEIPKTIYTGFFGSYIDHDGFIRPNLGWGIGNRHSEDKIRKLTNMSEEN